MIGKKKLFNFYYSYFNLPFFVAMYFRKIFIQIR